MTDTNLHNRIIQYNVLNTPWPLPDNSVDCCVTSPPYWGLRDYNNPDQLGLEKTPEEYVEKMVKVFNEVHRILKPVGTLWLNLGDSYANGRIGCDDQQKFYDRTHGYKSKALESASPKDGVVLDHFMGAGTTALVALSHGRKFIGFELNPDYITIANKRLKQKFGMFYNSDAA